MKIIQSAFLNFEQKETVFKLWNSEYPEGICYSEILEFEYYLRTLSNICHYLLINDKNQILGWAFTFIREDQKWFAIILNSKIHSQGYGTLLLDELKRKNSFLNGWVIDHSKEVKQNKETYNSPITFYIKNGFIINRDIRIENDKISAVKIMWKRQ